MSIIILPVENPTLLSDRELNRALTHYINPVESNYTYKDLSHNFINHCARANNYQTFKNELYEYLVGSIDPKYGKNPFNKKLYRKAVGKGKTASFQSADVARLG